MITPRLASVIERRLLVNYRVDPQVAARQLPAALRPQLVRGWAVAGICLIRLGDTRPRLAPGGLGLRSENAAHRFAVEWDGPSGPETGVYIPRRDSGSAINVLAGGRIFPGDHDRADFDVQETPDELSIAFASRDGRTTVAVEAAVAERFGGSKLFDGLDEVSAFFRKGSKGFSATRAGRRLDGMELRTDAWQIEPATLRSVRSSFFEDPERFPPGSATLDCAVLMRDVPVTWHPLPAMATAA
ncbi:DUF2071 domain-containing protein [Kitasatospora atroaurantiaca]|uniref:Uncharacterized protein DUF2071 n=1 Tax=Kitasatospora atroaurantiaca TaxID=285545 RepID=A0A561F0X0_9ACTN|nr:DUF2071 domain-containing protein [Kitasatospora atroaurantiaca]TWE21510.1 uncharacterized protein DUF2071 [Kitasatospora atroaurantiaca]